MKPLTFNEDCVLHFAMRYAIGRQTLAPTIVVAELERNWDRLKLHTRDLILDEVAQAIKNNRAGDPCDVKEWEKLFTLGN